ncbi:MAG: 4-(cytidine 5'-diphospho)-2-C-methyl-D-erythritol kinase [Campylobacterota bacterium]
MQRKSYAKVNIFLKIIGKSGEYHKIASRFATVYNLYDTITFTKSDRKAFNIIGNFSCKKQSNTVYKAYNMIKHLKNVKDFFDTYSVKVEKRIPEFAGLGGGSSNAATFLLMANEYCNLNLTKDELCKIAVQIGADVPFFIYEYSSANVTGIGEIVKKFDEEKLNIETFTPGIQCDTKEIFKTFSQKFYKELSQKHAHELMAMNSIDVLNKLDIYKANDLYESAAYIQPNLKKYEKRNWYFSGSGSSFFKVNNE